MKDINFEVRIQGQVAQDIGQCLHALSRTWESLESIKAQASCAQEELKNTAAMLRDYWSPMYPMPSAFRKAIESISSKEVSK